MAEELPILNVIPEVKEKLLHHRMLILQAPPGAGKSTVLPIELMNEQWLKGKKILMLEPRRLAARSVAGRMAVLINDEIGKTIGYRVRFDNKVSSGMRVEVVTEGILTRMLQTDNSLEDVGLVIFDEFHERSLHADLALALCLQAQQVLRDDLRILIMSATLDGNRLSSLLNSAPVVNCEGRQFPVKINYINTDSAVPLPLSVTRAIKKALTENEGDVLVFLPGTGEIHRTNELLETEHISARVHLLYGDLSPQQQQLAILPDPKGRRKVILATSIAETSLTIEGITVVVDSGYSRIPKFDLRTGLTRLETVRVTKDAADQRAGRAGRLGPGVCYRLWSEGTNIHLNPQRNPEIMDADLAPLLLELCNWGIKDVNELTWISPPPVGAVNQARELLQQLGAIHKSEITQRGKEMLRLPTHPRIAHMLLEAQLDDKKGKQKGLTAIATDIAALLEERDPLQKESGADLTLRLEALRKWRAKERVNADRISLERIERIALSWRKMLKLEMDNAIPAEEDVGLLLAAAYPERIARQLGKDDARFRLANGRIVKLREEDPLIREEWLAVAHLDAGNKEGKIFLAAPLNHEDLLHLAELVEVLTWDPQRGIIIAVTETRIGSITIESTPLKKIPDEQRVKILCDAIRSEGINNMLNWLPAIKDWQTRIMSLRVWRPAEEWPDVRDEVLLNSLEEWLGPYLAEVSKRDELKKLDLTIALGGFLSWELNRRLDELAPAALKVPSGSMIRLTYFEDGGSPEMAVRLQEVFGMLETPAVNEGRNKVLLHLLSPARRPVQVTQDIHSFWKNTYAEVRKELRIRYPRHSWPEDPWTAQAIRGPVRRKNN
ncbi:MAG: ATP-dependent helicase HrpB [Bacteroidetes bacterium]|nr:ATP-dependent helicase HrpB [Bacteroidota bacterium]